MELNRSAAQSAARKACGPTMLIVMLAAVVLVFAFIMVFNGMHRSSAMQPTATPVSNGSNSTPTR